MSAQMKPIKFVDAKSFFGMIVMIFLLVVTAVWLSLGGIFTRKGRECFRKIFRDK
ncbi:hypothetical protein [Caballeronia sp. M23-90]